MILIKKIKAKNNKIQKILDKIAMLGKRDKEKKSL